MKKIAVLIPSYNESDNINNITKLIDESLCKYDYKYESIIVNADNNSPDKTNFYFNNTKTIHRKVSILTNIKGKGVNLYNFFKYVIDNDIDYMITVDADLKSFNSTWIDKYIEKLELGYDFICPLYKRRKEEGNTTNHFIVPILYMLYGKFIRQPIGGDYAFNRKYVLSIMEEEFTTNILEYGIDIFMVVTGIVKDMKMCEVYLGDKIHRASYDKILSIFESVLLGFCETYNHYKKRFDKEFIKYKPFKYENVFCEFREDINNIYLDYLKEYDKNKYKVYEDKWLDILIKYIDNIEYMNKELVEEIKYLFINRVVSFWDNIDSENYELELLDFMRKLEIKYETKDS